MQRRFPQEVIDELIDWVSVGSEGQKDPHLRACSLVAQNWVERSRYHLFDSIHLASSLDISRWIENIHPGVDGLSRHVKKLWIHIGWDQWSQRFSSAEHLRSFTRIEDLRLTYWCGGQAVDEQVEEAFRSFGESVRSLSVSLLRGDVGSFLRFLSLFPHLDDLSIITSYLDGMSEPLLRSAVTVRRSLALDGIEERFADALAGGGVRPKILKISVPNGMSYDGFFAACAPSVETITLSPTYGAYLDHTSLEGFTALRHVEIKLTHPKYFFADVHTVLRPVASPHFERITFNFFKVIKRADLEGPETVATWANADEVLYDLSTRRSQQARRLLLVVKGKFDPTSPIEDLAGTMRSLLPRFMDVGVVETEDSVDIFPWPRYGM